MNDALQETWDDRKPMKVVGRRKEPVATLAKMDPFFRLCRVLAKGRPFIPKGVHRFKTFEEADAWQMKMITRR